MDNYSDESFQQWLSSLVERVKLQTKSIPKESLEVFQPESFVEACTGLTSLSIKGYTSSVLNKWLTMLLKQLSSPEIHKKLPYALDEDLFCPLQTDSLVGQMASMDAIRRLPKCVVCGRIATRFTINTACKCISCYKCAKAHLLDNMIQAQGRTPAIPCYGCKGLLRNVTWSVAYYERLLKARVQCHDSRCTFEGTLVEYCEHSLSVHMATNSLESHNASIINSSFIDATQYEESNQVQQNAPYMFGAYGNEEPVISLTTSSQVDAGVPSQTVLSEQSNQPPQMIPMYSESTIRHGKGKGVKRQKSDTYREKVIPITSEVSVPTGSNVLPAGGQDQQSAIPPTPPLPISITPVISGLVPSASSLLPPEPMPPPSKENNTKNLTKKKSPVVTLIMGLIVGIFASQVFLFFTNFGSIFPIGYNGIRYVNRI